MTDRYSPSRITTDDVMPEAVRARVEEMRRENAEYLKALQYDAGARFAHLFYRSVGGALR